MKHVHKFSKENPEFFSTLKSRVNEFFSDNNIKKDGGWQIWLKVIVMSVAYFVPYILMLSGFITSTPLILIMWTVMGFGMAGLGLNVMHDANHGSLSKNKKINNIMGYSMNFIGGNKLMWKLQHNVLHHSFTNIEGADSDLDHVSLFRFSPHKKKLKIHKLQHIYAWFFYGMLTLSKLVLSDFSQLFKYNKRGLVKNFKREFAQIVFWKLVYITYALVLPLIFIPASAGVIVLGFFIMHFIAGFILSAIFQTAHIVTSSEFPVGDDKGNIKNNWAIHQLNTTANYASNNPVFSWFVGGLNFQVEHHLFQSISHVHYSKIAKIVERTAKEFKVPYYNNKTFLHACWDHTMMLKQIGRA